jgi:chorismate synthase
VKIIITGPKGSGKTTVTGILGDILGIPAVDTDTMIEKLHGREKGEQLSFREIYNRYGEEYFRGLEERVCEDLNGKDWLCVATGGGTLYRPRARRLLLDGYLLFILTGNDQVLWERIKKDGLPVFLQGPDGFDLYCERNRTLYEVAGRYSDGEVDVTGMGPEEVAEEIREKIENAVMLGSRKPSTFGELIRVTTFGESHGKALGVVLDGLAPGITIDEGAIQNELDRRRPGQSRVTTQRDEKDRIEILSGVMEGKTTGTPICMVVYNRDQDSSKYEELKDLFRPGHADFTFWKKFGIRDHRGGGRSSGRETLSRVASGAVAKNLCRDEGIEFFAFSQEIGGIRGEVEDLSVIEKNEVRAADPVAADKMIQVVQEARSRKDSVGGVVKCIIRGVPPGLGDPVFMKLDARLSQAMLSIGAVKGIEFGSGFLAARLTGSENNDEMTPEGFLENNAGGILGGISTGEDIVIRLAVKPTPSVARQQKTVDMHGDPVNVEIQGRHDPCILPRIVPVVESMAALVILDALMMQKALGHVHEDI